jgi:RNA polymerase sigma-70 factor, ECF subfamily
MISSIVDTVSGPPVPDDNAERGHLLDPDDVDSLDVEADLWLVEKARSGDVDAYEVLLRRHRVRIYRIALRMLGDAHDAEDVAQDVVIQVWTALAGFTGASSFTTWLYRIVVNRCLNKARSRRWSRPVLEDDPSPAAGAEEMVIARHRMRATMAAIAQLPPEQRAVIVLHQLEGLSYREVAAVVNVSEDAVRGRLHRARLSLAESLRSWS